MTKPTTTTAVSTADSVLANLRSLQKTLESTVPTHKYLSFSGQTGQYLSKVQGSDDPVAIDVGGVFVLDFAQTMHGYVCWKNKRVIDSVVWNMIETPNIPGEDSLPDHGPYETPAPGETPREGWKYQITLVLKNMATGDVYCYKTGPDSAVRATQAFIHKVLLAAQTRDITKTFPTVTLGRRYFVPNGRTNKIYIPNFILDEKNWIDAEKADVKRINIQPGVFLKASEDGGAAEVLPPSNKAAGAKNLFKG